MDSRVYEHAEILVDHCTSIERADKVLVRAPPQAENLVVALCEKIGERNASPVLLNSNSRAARAYMRACNPEEVTFAEHFLALLRAADVSIEIKGTANTKESTDVAPEKKTSYAKVHQPIIDAKMEKRWVGTQFPTSGSAQEAEMSTDAYADFVWDAIIRDWDDQREYQKQLVEILSSVDELRIQSGSTTDLRMSIEGMLIENDYGEVNMPGGEVFTAPIPDTVDGKIHFDKPLLAQGRKVKDVYLRFDDGEVVEYGAAKNEEILTTILNTDAGSRKVGEIGIGMNYNIDRFTANMLFDEKMGDTVHLAIGRAYEMNVPKGRERNDSAVHQDMLVDMSDNSTISADREVIYRDGTFVFEDGFETI